MYCQEIYFTIVIQETHGRNCHGTNVRDLQEEHMNNLPWKVIADLCNWLVKKSQEGVISRWSAGCQGICLRHSDECAKRRTRRTLGEDVCGTGNATVKFYQKTGKFVQC